MIVGFTGTREGMTEHQIDSLYPLLKMLNPEEVHHGCCVGADAEFALYVSIDLEDRGIKLHAHPSSMSRLTDGDSIAWSDVVHSKKPPLERNKDIVDDCDLLIACPKEMEEQLRSGTWSTVRHARKKGKPVKVILPDGTVEND